MNEAGAFPAAPPGRPRTVDAGLHHDVADWLAWEAALLDARRFDAWLALLHPDIRYRMPVQVTTARRDERDDERPLGSMHHFDEDLRSLAQRVRRLAGEYAWTEDPPSRARRHLSNLRVYPIDASDDVEAHVNVLVFRSRRDVHPADLLSVGRVDRLTRIDGDWRLVRRDITVDEAVLRTQNLALFL